MVFLSVFFLLVSVVAGFVLHGSIQHVANIKSRQVKFDWSPDPSASRDNALKHAERDVNSAWWMLFGSLALSGFLFALS